MAASHEWVDARRVDKDISCSSSDRCRSLQKDQPPHALRLTRSKHTELISYHNICTVRIFHVYRVVVMC
jgi:hypothetical protein